MRAKPAWFCRLCWDAQPENMDANLEAIRNATIDDIASDV